MVVVFCWVTVGVGWRVVVSVCVVAVVLLCLTGRVLWRVLISSVCHCCCVVLARGSCGPARCDIWQIILFGPL